MVYHLLLAMTGLAVLLGGWLLVQHLAGAQTGAAPDPGLEGAVPNPSAPSVAACGGCVACGPADVETHRGHPLPRDGPATDGSAIRSTAATAPVDPMRVMP